MNHRHGHHSSISDIIVNARPTTIKMDNLTITFEKPLLIIILIPGIIIMEVVVLNSTIRWWLQIITIKML